MMKMTISNSRTSLDFTNLVSCTGGVYGDWVGIGRLHSAVLFMHLQEGAAKAGESQKDLFQTSPLLWNPHDSN